MMRLFNEFFYHSHASLRQLHNQALQDLREHVITVADKWRQKILAMPIEAMHDADFLDRVKRSAEYFELQLRDILEKPIKLSAKVETNNKQAARRLDNTLPDLRQAWLARRYLLQRIAELGFSVDTYLREKYMSTLDAFPEETLKKTKRQRKPQTPKEPKPKTWEVSYDLYRQGMKPDRIAQERGLTLGTVLGHLVRYVDSGSVSFNDLVSPEHQQAIEHSIRKVGTESNTTAIKDLCPSEVTYDEIRLVIGRMKR
jgi:hypothetical protein